MSIDAALLAEAVAWRRHLHAHPETGFEEHDTAAFVAGHLRRFGLSVADGLGGTGVVATLRRGNGGRSIALRADMDALLIAEDAPDRAHASTRPGRMHACGHDGHTAALLAAAAALAADPGFAEGCVHFVFQPAEEHGRGMLAMLDGGLLARFPAEEAYGLHIMPGLPVGAFATRTGALMAAEDNFEITITGQGVHAARPHLGVDPILAASALVLGLQQIVARRVDPVAPAVVSVTEFLTDGTRNVIPTRAVLKGDCRSYDPAASALIEAEMRRIATGIATGHAARAEVAYTREFVPTLNAPGPTAAALAAAGAVFETVDPATPPIMPSEDFARLLAHIPGNFAFVGNGEDSAALHNPRFDFNDAALAPMAGYWIRLVRDRLGG